MDWWTLDPGYLPTVLYGPCGLVDPGTRVQGRCWGAVDPSARVVGTVHYHVSHVTQFPNKTVVGGYSSPLQESELDWVWLTRYSPAPEVWLLESTPGVRVGLGLVNHFPRHSGTRGHSRGRVPWHPGTLAPGAMPYPPAKVPWHPGTLALGYPGTREVSVSSRGPHDSLGRS